jgi:hypothetical protein
MSGIADKVLELHRHLDAAAIDHAFGGALALAWCTERARGTIDIDLNVFVAADAASAVFDALPAAVVWTAQDVALVERDGQVRVWWASTPLDLFVNMTEFHEQLAVRAQQRAFAGTVVPFLSCSDLAVFKAFFNRTKDWADLEEMLAAGSLDLDRVVGVLVRYLGPGDERVARLLSLGGAPPPPR